VVATLTVTLVAEFSLIVTLAGDTVQVASEGAPAQVSEMVPLSPPSGATLKLYGAVCPGVTVVVVVEPAAAVTLKSSP